MAEAERSFAVIRCEVTRSASPEEIARVLAPRFAIYPQPARTDAEWAAWWADYTSALDDLPPSAIEAAMAAYVKGADSEFFPKPGRIRDLAKTTPNPLAMACEGVRRNIEREQRRAQLDYAPSRSEPAPKQSVAEMMAEFNRAMAAKAPAPKPVRAPVSGPVDASGITALMRQRMERDGG